MSVLWLTERDVVDLISLNEAIDILAQVLPLETTGVAVNGPKAFLAWEGNKSHHALVARRADCGQSGTKTWINTPHGAIAVYLLFDSVNGKLLAAIEANTLGMLRTSGTAGLASKLLAPAGTDELVLIGSGRQAMLQAMAVAASLPLRRIRLFSRTRANQLAFAQALEQEIKISVLTPDSLEAAVADASLITLATRAVEPYLSRSMLAPEVHINAIGAVLPANAEICPDVIDEASLIVVDNKANVRATSRELAHLFAQTDSPSPVETLGERLAQGREASRPAGLTIFKSAGMGLSDLAVASKLFDAARNHGRGIEIADPISAKPRWTPASVS